MRVCLFWNAAAGEGVSLDQLTSEIAKAGHHVDRVVERGEDLEDHLHDRIDGVVAAGGDGTIASAARVLAGGDLPLAILPLGTANNIATSLGISGDSAEMMSRWAPDRVARIDVGVVEWEGKRRHFFESVGAGLVTHCIDVAHHSVSKDDPESHLEEARQLFIDKLARQQPRSYTIEIDGQQISGEYLLVEALNVPLIGPGLRLTEGASAADGLLSVVAIAPSERGQLDRHLHHLRAGADVDAGFKSWRVPALTVRGAARIHIDDTVKPAADEISIRIAPAALPLIA